MCFILVLERGRQAGTWDTVASQWSLSQWEALPQRERWCPRRWHPRLSFDLCVYKLAGISTPPHTPRQLKRKRLIYKMTYKNQKVTANLWASRTLWYVDRTLEPKINLWTLGRVQNGASYAPDVDWNVDGKCMRNFFLFHYRYVALSFWIMSFPALGDMSQQVKLNVSWKRLIASPDVHSVGSEYFLTSALVLILATISLDSCPVVQRAVAHRHVETQTEMNAVVFPQEGWGWFISSPLIFPCLF